MKSPVDVRMHAIAFLYDHMLDVPVWIRRLTPGQVDDISKLMISWYGTLGEFQAIVPLEDVEKREITRAIMASGCDVQKAAKLLGVGKTTLYRRLRQWGFSIPELRLIHQASALIQISGKSTRSSLSPNSGAVGRLPL